MKEINDILKAFQIAKRADKTCALATVVKVEGSSYRQPGARMLITEDGELTGAISGGCLEGDALRKALLCIDQKQNKLVTYDTSLDEDSDLGVQLGCNGIVHILFEYIDKKLANNPIALLERLVSKRRQAVIGTFFTLDKNSEQPGTILFFCDNEDSVIPENSAGIQNAAERVIDSRLSQIENTTLDGSDFQVLLHYVPPMLSLVIAGAGNDIQPLVKAASLLGWEVTIADGRASHATSKRFPDAKQLVVSKPEGLSEKIVFDKLTFVALMTHNYKYDLEVLQFAIQSEVPYIGILGPKTKLERMLSDMQADGVLLDNGQMSRIYSPIGLDIGAETAEEIAISIVAEIQAVIGGKPGNSLKFKTDKIHAATIVA